MPEPLPGLRTLRRREARRAANVTLRVQRRQGARHVGDAADARRAEEETANPSRCDARLTRHRRRPRGVRGGLAGRAAAASTVELFEMRPQRAVPRTRPTRWPNSSAAIRCAARRSRTPSGLLKEELARLDSLIVSCGARNGRAGRRRAGGRPRALRGARRVAVRGASADLACSRRGRGDPARPAVVVACGPLPRDGVVGEHRRAAGALRPAAAAAALLRRGLADRGGRFARRVADVSQVALREGRRRRLPQHPARPRAVSRVRPRSAHLPRHQPKDFERRRDGARRTSRAACRSRRWPTAATTRCASGR